MNMEQIDAMLKECSEQMSRMDINNFQELTAMTLKLLSIQNLISATTPILYQVPQIPNLNLHPFQIQSTYQPIPQHKSEEEDEEEDEEEYGEGEVMVNGYMNVWEDDDDPELVAIFGSYNC